MTKLERSAVPRGANRKRIEDPVAPKPGLLAKMLLRSSSFVLD
jgi:hypothetical protein